ncbi:MAG TPA: DUF2834 domain-containing protein [Terriglobales bacterium]|nr:DUF2834 domain-containing protein [Terriglobales bacterium]
MNAKRIGLSVLLADFVALTAYAVYQHGYVAFFELAVSSMIGAQVFLDLIIALSLVMVWMWRDARAQGVSPWPYVLLTLVLGSIGPLAYLVRRAGNESAPADVVARAA